MNNIIKCPHCNRCFFGVVDSICPLCKKNTNEVPEMPDVMNDIFGGFNND